MAHTLARLRGVKLEDTKKVLKADAPNHAKQGLYLEHLWPNTDDLEEVLFLFRTDDLGRATQLTQNVHTQARKEDPNAKPPQMIFLEEK